MRARLLFALALIGTLLFASALPSRAAVTNDAPFLNTFKFWSPSLCMAIGDTGLNAAVSAQSWNNATGGKLAITASNNCVNAGYPPSRRFTIDAYNGSTSNCTLLTDRNGDVFNPAGDATAIGGNWVYNDNPIIWINRNCWGSIFSQRHFTTQGIGQVLGLERLNSNSYQYRVMNNTAFSRENVEYADLASGAVLDRLYG
jgi:hypothetical protein